MAVSELSQSALRQAARRAYERGRTRGAALRGGIAGMLALPAFLFCNASTSAGLCLAGFALVVSAGWVRGEGYGEGTQAGALAGILPCLFPAAVRAFDPDFCATLFSHGAWLCAAGGVAAGVILGLRGRISGGWPFWSGALAALALSAALGCIPAGALGFAGLALGVLAGGGPILAVRRAFV